MERTIELTAMWLTPLLLGASAVAMLPRDPTWSLLTGICAGFTLGVVFTRWAITRRL